LAPAHSYGLTLNEIYAWHELRRIKALRPPNLRRGAELLHLWCLETEALAEEFRERFGGERLTDEA